MGQSARKSVVLVVEDEVLIRMSAALMVEDAGYVAVEAGNADEAIAILDSRSDIGAVFTDINMSGSMDGWKLANAIRGRWPPIHLLMTSGLCVPDDISIPENGRFIRKPYNAHQVTAALRQLFGTVPGLKPRASGHGHSQGTVL